MKIKHIVISLLALCAPAAAGAAVTMVKASLDSAQVLMGKIRTLRLEVVQDKGLNGEFPLLANIGERGYVTLLNDTVELSARGLRRDTSEVGSGRIQIDWQVPVQVFDSGYYRLPEFVYVTGRDTVRSNSVVLTVNPVKVTADDPISPLTGPEPPQGWKWTDYIPDIIYYWWWILPLLTAAAMAGAWLVGRYRTKGYILPPKPQTPPDVEAMQRLKRLKARKLWESGREKEFYTLLTDILRLYLYRRFGIKAMEMTSRQIMDKLAEEPGMLDNRRRMRQILDMADFVKFAMVRPMAEDNVKAYDNAVEFVEATRPQPEPGPEADKGAKGTVKADKGTARTAKGMPGTEKESGVKIPESGKGGES